jgi:hypothetical protein
MPLVSIIAPTFNRRRDCDNQLAAGERPPLVLGQADAGWPV